MTIRYTLGGIMLLAFIAAGCGKLADSDDAAAGDGDGDGDGTPNTGPDPKMITCGSTECRASSEEVKWGAEPCCVEGGDEVCGLESDSPSVIIPDLLGTGEMIIPVTDVVAMLAGMAGADAGPVVPGNPEPVVNCMPKGQPGDPSLDCPGADLPAMGMMGAAPAPDLDAGAPVDSGMAMMAAFEGCCRPDGYCGYLDTNTGFGCVKRTESIIGMINGDEDITCGN